MQASRKIFVPSKELRPGIGALKRLSRENQGFDCNSYSSSLNFFSKSSNEKGIIADFISSKVLPLVEKKQEMLDIGAGSCGLTMEIGKNFGKITAIDKTNHGKMQSSRNFTFIERKFPSECLNGKKFDFILGSHVLYYHQSDIEFLKAAYAHLKPGGTMAFIVNSDKGAAAAMNAAFGGKNKDIDQLVRDCEAVLQSDITRYSFTVKVRGIALIDITRSAMCYLYNILGSFKPEKLQEYLQANFKKPNNMYEMDLIEDALVISKPKAPFSEPTFLDRLRKGWLNICAP